MNKPPKSRPLEEFIGACPGLGESRTDISLRPQSAEQLIKTHAAMIVQRVAELPDYCSPEERPNEMTCTDIELMHIAETQLHEFAEAYAAAESRKHNWKCVAPENGYYRWQCQNPGCSETAPYPSVLPDSSCAYSAALPVGESPAAAPPINITERYKLIIETFRKYMTEEDFKKAMQELANNKGENHVSK